MRRPRVGVTVDFLPARGFSKLTVYDRYVAAVAEAGALPLVLAATPGDIDEQLDLVDGVLLPGGDDLDPARWGGSPGPRFVPSDPRRTEYEISLVEAALGRDVPLLGVCLGLQVLNVACGGTIVQDVTAAPEDDEGAPRVTHEDAGLDLTLRHDVEVSPGSLLARAIGVPAGGRVSVNSAHHQAPGRIGDGLVVSARAADGVVEALEHPERRFVLGVQWHPDVDRGTDARSAALFRSFVEACQARS